MSLRLLAHVATLGFRNDLDALPSPFRGARSCKQRTASSTRAAARKGEGKEIDLFFVLGL